MKIDDKAVLSIGEADAESLAISSGGQLRLKTALGHLDVAVEVKAELPSGVVSFPIHFKSPAVKDLLEVKADKMSRVVYARQGSVSLELDPALSLKVLPAASNGAGKKPDAEQN